MSRLELEITDKMMEKLQKKADDYAVGPADIAKRIISCHLVREETPAWKETLLRMLPQTIQAVTAACKKYASEAEKQAEEEQ